MTTIPVTDAGMRRRGSLYTKDTRTRYRQAVDRLVTGLVTLCTLVAVVLLVVILGYVILRGLPAITPSFFFDRPLPLGEPGGGVGPAFLGSLIMLAVASMIGIPLGILAGIYLSEVGTGKFPGMVRFGVDLMAGLPSIVIGVFVWALVVRQLVGNYSALAGGIALAIIMIPIITRTVEEILRLVPDSLREAALALGLPRWKVILFVVLPTAKAGLATGVMLSLARAGGETAPLLLTALGNQFFSTDLLQPMASLPVQIYNYAIAPYDDWITKAWGGALVLILTIGTLSLLTRLVVSGRRFQ